MSTSPRERVQLAVNMLGANRLVSLCAELVDLHRNHSSAGPTPSAERFVELIDVSNPGDGTRHDPDDRRDPQYLGDGAYVHHDGYQVWLTTQEGDEIALEPTTLAAFEAYVHRLRKTREEQRT